MIYIFPSLYAVSEQVSVSHSKFQCSHLNVWWQWNGSRFMQSQLLSWSQDLHMTELQHLLFPLVPLHNWNIDWLFSHPHYLPRDRRAGKVLTLSSQELQPDKFNILSSGYTSASGWQKLGELETNNALTLDLQLWGASIRLSLSEMLMSSADWTCSVWTCLQEVGDQSFTFIKHLAWSNYSVSKIFFLICI